jgi:hypothetical protein
VSSIDGLVDFAQKRIERPESGPAKHTTYLKTSKNRTTKAVISAESLEQMGDVFLLIVKES